MNFKAIIILFCCSFLSKPIFCQGQDNTPVKGIQKEVAEIAQKKNLNFFIVSKRHKGKLDPASRFNIFRAKVKSLFRQKKFVAIIASNARQASNKIQYRLEKYNAGIGTIWFDSHGMYKKGYSLFFIGTDEYSYKTLKDQAVLQPLKQLGAFANTETKVIIGSCYAGATYYRASIDYKDTTRMNGDSLMIALGNVFGQSRIYACESWVMTKPGLFLKRAAVVGYPGRKLFRDVCYQPAWENMGKWNEYNAATNCFNPVGPVTLDMYGNVIVRRFSHKDTEHAKKRVAKNLEKLHQGLYK